MRWLFLLPLATATSKPTTMNNIKIKDRKGYNIEIKDRKAHNICIEIKDHKGYNIDIKDRKAVTMHLAGLLHGLVACHLQGPAAP